MRYFINRALKQVYFSIKNVRFGSYLRRPDAMHEAVLHPLRVRRIEYPEQVCKNIAASEFAKKKLIMLL